MTIEERVDQLEEIVTTMAGRIAPELFPETPLKLEPLVERLMLLNLSEQLMAVTLRIMERKGIPIKRDTP